MFNSMINSYFKVFNFLMLIFIMSTFLIECSDSSKNMEEQYTEIRYSNDIFIDMDYTFENSGLYIPTMARISPDDKILILDRGDDCIYIFSKDGVYISKIGQSGQGPGDLLFPKYFCIDNNGDIYVYEEGNLRFSIFSKNGAFLKSFRTKNSNSVFYFSVTDNHEIVVNSPGSDYYITVYSNDGKILNEIGKAKKYFQRKSSNAEYVKGYSFFTKDQRYYFFSLSMPIVKIFDKNGNKLLEKNIDLPEIINQMDTYVGPGHKYFGRVFPRFYTGIIFKNNFFYIKPVLYDTDTKTYFDYIYKVNLNLEILKKLTLPPQKVPSSYFPRRGARFGPKDSVFDITIDETFLYYPLRFEPSVVRSSVKK